jgi:alkaline phosphatase D
MAGLNAGTRDQPQYFLENWGGYPAARRRFLERLGADPVTNPVLLSGDWHAGMVSDVHVDDRDTDSPVVAVELMAPALSSPVHGLARESNPQVHHVVERNGYMTIRVEAEHLTAAFRVLDDVARADSGITTDSVWRIHAGAYDVSPL